MSNWTIQIALVNDPNARPVWLERWRCPEPPANLSDEDLTQWVELQVYKHIFRQAEEGG